MKSIKIFLKRYKAFFILLALNTVLLIMAPEIGKSSFLNARNNLVEMISVVPPIFILLGLLDVWIERETMMKYMGQDSGAKGAVLAFFLGSAAAGPLYAAFPLAAVLLKKGAKLFNVFVFLGAWSTTKIPLLIFEASNLGLTYTVLRFISNLIGILIIAWLLEKMLSQTEQNKIYENIKTI